MFRDNTQKADERLDGGFLVDNVRGDPHRRGERLHGPVLHSESDRCLAAVAARDEEH